MLVAVCGYLCIPSIASWVVQANGFAAYNKTVSKNDLARKRRSRMDGRQSMGRGQRRRLGGIIGR